MTIVSQHCEEALGVHHDDMIMADVRQRTREAVNRIAAGIAPGMLEEDANRMARSVLRDLGMQRGWHGIFVRFGPNTVKFYGEPSVPGVRLGDDDIFIVDIGPVWQKWEGDGGDTFVTGGDPEMLRAREDVHILFDRVRAHWANGTATGRDLYAYAGQEADRMGWKLNLDLDGHRLGDFPHALIHRGALAEIDYVPAPSLWVLEIHIRHKTRQFGAFFEDMLLA